jgi:hypothetical protein
MKKSVFKVLAMINRWVLPRYSKRDISKLSKIDQAIIGFRYWVTRNSLD